MEAAEPPPAKRIRSEPTGPPPVIEPSNLTEEQRQAAKRALKGENLFVSGAAGTGKSYLLRYIIQELERRHSGEVAITAPTGLAAVNVGGQTIHSFAGIGLVKTEDAEIRQPERYYVRLIKSRKPSFERWRNTKVLIVDEVSMLEPSLFELLEYLGRELRGKRSSGFGGLQVVLCGDFLQLPPIDATRSTNASWTFCFETPAWKRCNLDKGTIILKEIVRQAGDPAFAKLLNHIRAGECPRDILQACAGCRVGTKPPPADGITPTRLYCTNCSVDRENEARLRELPGEERIYHAKDNFSNRLTGGAPLRSDEKKKIVDVISKKIPTELRLKEGAQVILLRKMHNGLVNGSRGRVVHLHDSSASVLFDTGQLVKVERERFQQYGSAAICYRHQLPLKLGWALTIHKSQGMTLTRAEVLLDGAFSCGQAYVALSRLTGFAGLWLGGRGLSAEQIKAHPAALTYYGIGSGAK
eukprot:TRINITY_DN32488_c1_g1_i2.p1 TRINITY_DN32488_c1_g1~~TRINITY_DN32488_c1_g1_i2.p1  ORF type:complete len:519 (-),score=110.58 TRINITY_DN32488_c1_g1_i2:71-1477(-)